MTDKAAKPKHSVILTVDGETLFTAKVGDDLLDWMKDQMWAILYIWKANAIREIERHAKEESV